MGIASPDPETESSTHYFWTAARNRKIDDKELDEQIYQGVNYAFMSEEAPIIEWQQRYGSGPKVIPIYPQLLAGDAGGARARRVADKMLAEQALRTPQPREKAAAQ